VKKKQINFSIAGAGNVGCQLAHSLLKRGYHLKYIYKKSKFSSFNQYVSEDIETIVKESDIIFISTQESKIKEVSDGFSKISELRGKFFFHTSNSLNSNELESLKRKGAQVASFSPVQTFVHFEPESDLFKGIYFLLEGDPGAIEIAEEIARRLNAHIIKVDKNKKAFYHIAAVSSCNFMFSILSFAQQQLKKTGTPDLKILLPLVNQTLANVEKKGLKESLTGPLQRGQIHVIKKHLESLEPDEAEFYKTLTKYLEDHLL
jgi:predicted short-subunit dehydrogenase-like oxidoreductase (DUF2520 family)